MAFERLGTFEEQLHSLKRRADARGDPTFKARITQFVDDVHKQVAAAFDYVADILLEVSKFPPSELNNDSVAKLRGDVEYAYNSDIF